MPHPITRLQARAGPGPIGRLGAAEPAGGEAWWQNPRRWQRLSPLNKYWRPSPDQAGGKPRKRPPFRGFPPRSGRRQSGTPLAIDRDVMRRNQRGFTIIELLVVVA